MRSLCGNQQNRGTLKARQWRLGRENREVRQSHLPTWRRRAVLNDLSPAATFIAARLLTSRSIQSASAGGCPALSGHCRTSLAGCTRHCIRMAKATSTNELHASGATSFSCPECGRRDRLHWMSAWTPRTTERRSSLARMRYRAEERRLGNAIRLRLIWRWRTPFSRKTVPGLINYTMAGRSARNTGQADHAASSNPGSDAAPIPTCTSFRSQTCIMRLVGLCAYGITSIHQYAFFHCSPRTPVRSGRTASAIRTVPMRLNMLLFFVEGYWGMSAACSIRSDALFTRSINTCRESSMLRPKVVECHRLRTSWTESGRSSQGKDLSMSHWKLCEYATGAMATHGSCPDKRIDYIFTDPPFGENIYYADLNFLVESWHRVRTSMSSGSHRMTSKGERAARSISNLMQRCFEEYHRVLKPGRWMTVVFHNSQNAVWNAIQEAISISWLRRCRCAHSR